MKVKIWLFLFVMLIALLVFSSFHSVPTGYASPDVASYYPSGYNLLGSTAYVSGSLTDLQSDNGIYMTFRSYGSSYITSTKAMFAYGEGTVATPRYRIWDGISWGTEASASNTASTVQWVVLKSNPKRYEKVLGTLASTGAIHVQVWNGSSWSAAQVLGSGVGTFNDAYRGFDVAYEQTSGRAIVVFVPSTTATDPQYVIWDGSSWTAPATIDIPTTGVVYWVELASRPLSNQIALMTLDANADIAGIIWDGSAWGNAKTLTATASTATRECFAVEYEQQSGYAMFVWGEVATDLYYWRWNGSAWIGTTKTLLDIPAQGGVSNWISLKADPSSNRLMLGVQDAGADLNTRQWNGANWDTATEHPEHDASTENAGSRNFDIEYETSPGHTGHAILVWGDGATASWKHWTPTTGASGWSAATVLTGSDDTAVTQLRRNSDGKIFAAILDDPASATDDLVEYRWDGSTWSSRLIVEGTPSMTAQPMMEPFMVAPDAHSTPIEYTMEVEFLGSSNTDYWTQLTWTIDSAWTTDSVAVTLQLYNYTFGGYPTSGDGYISYTSSATPNTDETKSQTITTNPAHFRDSVGNWKVKVKGVKSTSTQFDFKADLVKFEVIVGDTAPPVWSNAGTNNTLAGQPTLFYVKWTDNVGLSGFIFGTNNTGTWVNDTWTPMGGTTNWSNVTKILNSTARLVQWRVWANDTSNNWNDTGILSLTLLHLPVASFTYSPPTPYTGEIVTFNASATYDPDGTIVSYFWDFGDGTNGTGMVTTHAYADNRVYTVTLTVTDNDGLTDTDTQSITVLNRPPIASFTESATSVPTGTAIFFNASDSYDPDGTIVSCFWDFGDGTNGTGVTTEHAYADNGIYTVTLTITDDDGATATATATKTVLNRPPLASFTESATTVYTGEVIYFNASASYDPDGSIVSYFWDFGDGTNATGVNVSHSYVGNGVYTVTLTITDNDGATAVASSTKTVLNRPPVASFTESATTVYKGEVIYFNASASYDPDGTIVSYFWDFGDGTNATDVTVSHSYANTGTYTVTLTVTDNGGATASVTVTKTVLSRPPVASFTESATTVYTGEIIYFNASSSYDPDGVIVSYQWNFGDGNITTVTNPIITHAYADNGTYTVTLTVVDNDGATGSASAVKTVLNRAPVAMFTESATTVYTLETITFNASESYDLDGSIVSYTWNFGDGNITVATNPIITHAYADNGTYTVTLTVSDNDGATSTASSTKVVLNRPPVANFTESATTVFTGEVIYFNASSSYDLDGSIASYFWTFGDGTNATGVTVSHAYSDNGTYTVSLTVADNDGATATASSTKTVLNRPPVAFFTESATTVYKGEVIRFNASVSYDPDGSIVSYFWTFGDGTNATGVIVDHSYTNVGTYTVTLTVTDNDGATASTTAVKTVLSRPPVASFTESATTVYTGDVITFNASASYDPDGVIVSYKWDFGDGNITIVTSPVITHAFADNGTYTVTLTVTDSDGAAGSASSTKIVLNRAPVASFVEDKHTMYTGEVIQFNTSTSYDPDGFIVSYNWNFGDGNITTTTNPFITYAYSDNGTYTVTLTVTDNDGATATASDTKTVLNRPPVASFTESATTVLTGEVIYFNASTSYDPDGTIVSYFWTFGDGNNATGIIVNHAYADNGVYTVTLTITDNDGAAATASAIKTVGNRPPIASFTESATTVFTNEIIYFNASGSYDSDGFIVSYFWDFGDGTNATGVTTSHAYTENSVYTVTLTVTDDDGAKATATSTKTILNRAPEASFTESATTVLTGEVIYFNASSSYDPDGSIISYFWTFGDGTNATGVTVTHAYADNGTYVVTLTVKDNDGAAASTTATKTVLNRPPVVSFTESATTVLTGEAIHFNASASYDPDGSIMSFFWTFGDGNNATGVVVDHAYADNGSYTVILTVKDNDGATATATAVKTVLNRPPVASFTESATSVLTGEIIYFNASSSHDLDGYIVSYFWTFGDGTNATGVVTQHAYTENGVYNVTLTVTDNDGAKTTTTAAKYVQNRPPIASFTYSPSYPIASQRVTFNASSSYDQDGSIISYVWNFGDGNTTTVTSNIITHIYNVFGNYTVTLTVTDNDGDTGATTQIVMIRDYPKASFTYSPSFPITGETVTFNASSSVPNGGVITSYLWNFGDGTPLVNATNSVTTHVYSAVGNYTVTLTVTDSEGLSNIRADTVRIRGYPNAAFTFSPSYPIEKETVTFDASSSIPNGGVITSYKWNFGDGNTTTITNPTITHVYSAIGNYTVTLTVTDSEGLSNSQSKILSVRGYPIAIFTYTPSAPYVGDTVTFNASLSSPNGGAIVNYTWDFGDGSPLLNTPNPIATHIYKFAANRTVTLTITDSEGLSDTEVHSVVVAKAPIATFTYSPQFPKVGETVTFNASASYDPNGYIVSYKWDFGDGNVTTVTTSTIKHAYTSTGIYTVILTVTDNDGYTDTAKHTVTLGNPKASFTYTPEYPIVGQSITFNASASYDPNGYIVSYVWNFGDGNITSVTNPVIIHVYKASVTYTVALTVADNDGLTDTTTRAVSVGKAPVASFTYTPTTPYLGDTVTFNASSSTPSSGSITSYVWNFGDGSPVQNKTTPTITHVYTSAGNYTVSLTIKDSAGLSNTVTKTIKVLQSPVAIFTYSPTYPKVFDTVIFNASDSYDANGYIVSYVWNFGDGNITTATNPTITHVYKSAGNYTVVLIVADNQGYTHTATQSVYVSLRPPAAAFTSTPDFPIAHQNVTFNASSSYDLDGYIVSYRWDFGDGNITTGLVTVVIHRYVAAGNYTVTLTVKDNDNLTSTKTSVVRVRDYPTAAFSYTPSVPGVGSTVTFNASSSAPNGGVIVNYLWNFGDGSPVTNTTNPIVTHIFNVSGDYTITLTVTDSEGLTDTESKTIHIAQSPIASFTFSPSSPYVGDTVTFNASKSYDPDGYIISYLWNFGDGSPLINTSNPVTTHIYSKGGNFNVTLTVTDNQGFASTKTILVSVGKAPGAVFTYSPSFPIVNETVSFDASGSFDVRRSIANYTWNFGDGNITTVTKPIVTHVYTKEGNYTVSLTVIDTAGYADTVAQILRIRNYPIASFTYSPSYPIKGQDTTFDASASQPRGGVIISYLWNFGDGSPPVNTTNPITKHAYAGVGGYNVTLTVADSEGLTSTVSKSLKVRDYPTTDFTWSPPSPIATYLITFNASSSKANSGIITGYTWNFGDGNITTVTTPVIVHVYSTAKNYTVTLTVTNSEGLSSYLTKIVAVLNAPPIASFNYSPSFPIIDQTTKFDASGSYDPDGSIVSYKWNFGDGNITIVTTQIIYHVYKIVGNLTVTLTVTDNVGQSTSQTKTVRVGQLPVASFTYSPGAPYVGDGIAFNASQSYDPNGYIVSYLWNFGDGSTFLSQTSPAVTHTYSQGGNYTVELTITDNEGLKASTAQIVSVAKAPVAVFTYSPSYPIAGETVTFNASESYDARRPIVSYFWVFGGGVQANTTTPVVTYVYLKEGNYTVTLTVTDSGGYKDTTTRPVRIRNYPLPAFTVSPDSPIRGQSATFDASSSKPRGGVITSYLWDFGDGTTPLNTTNPIASHTYTTYGNYTVTLTVADSEGLSGYTSKIVIVREYPTASFTYAPFPVRRNVAATFDASASKPNGGHIISYTWDFGDGNTTTVTSSTITHFFKSTGLFTVKLTVTDSENLSNSAGKSITVVPAYPVASFTYAPEMPIMGQTATFNASKSYDPDGWISSYKWDFGDGTTTTEYDPIIDHVYNAIGFYNVTLTVTDYDGYTNSVLKQVEVIAYPKASFTWSPYYPQVSKPATFNASASTPGSGVIVSYEWNFGDGNITKVSDPVIIHVFNMFGSYKVTLVVTNSDGLSSSRSNQIYVYGEPVADFIWKPSFPLIGQTVAFNASTSQPSGGSLLGCTFWWDFGDGTSPVLVKYNPVVSHQYQTYGQYNVTLKVTNAGGVTGTTSKRLIVLSPPNAKFTWTPQSPYAYDTITFDASSSYDPDGSLASYEWNFGDGNTKTTTTPVITHYYLAGGNYTVTLNVTDNNGLWNTLSKAINVTAAALPLADFAYSPYSPGVFEQIVFNASTSTPRGGVIVIYKWNFGDGNVTTVNTSTIIHFYHEAGNYTVTLNVTNTAGLWATTSKQAEIMPICGPTASFTWSPTLPYFNSTVTFNASSSTLGWNGTLHPPIVSYKWDFGDGNITTVTNSVVSHVYSKQGNYAVTLTVTDVIGMTGNLTKTIMVSGLVGDITGPTPNVPDGKVDIRDIALVAKAFGAKHITDPSSPKYCQYWHSTPCSTCPHNPNCDINCDGKVDIRDIAIVAKQFGKTLSSMSLVNDYDTPLMSHPVYSIQFIQYWIAVMSFLALVFVLTKKVLVKRKNMVSFGIRSKRLFFEVSPCKAVIQMRLHKIRKNYTWTFSSTRRFYC